MDEYAGAGSGGNIQRLLAKSIHDKLSLECWRSDTTCLQPSHLSRKLVLGRPFHIQLYRMLSNVGTIAQN
jgi:hypothetical protein